MANSSIETPTFNIPPEPKPVPSLNSDEESFVILGKSLEGLSFDEDSGSSTSIILEAKGLLKEELDKISLQVREQELKNGHRVFANGVREGQPSISDNKVDFETSQYKFHTANFEDKTCDSTALPTMPSHLAVVADEPSKAISIISFAPNDFQSEELQNKVTQLVEENVNLKDTIIQNNNSMKAQYERIVAWQSEVEKVHQTHKEKFMKAKECIETLRKENASLQLEVDNFKNKENQQLVEKTDKENISKIELDKANDEIISLKEAMENVTLKHAEAINIDVGKQTLLEQKLAKYEEELQDAYKTIKELKEANEDLERKSLASLKMWEKSQKEIESLQTQLAKSLKHSDAASRLSYELEQARNKIVELERHKEVQENQLKEVNEKYDVVKADKKALSEEARVLTNVVEERLNELSNVQQQLSDRSLELQRLALQLKSEPKQQPNEVDSEQVTYLRQQLMQAQKAYTECNQTLVQVQAQVETLQVENSKFSQRLQTKQEEEGTIYALKAQLEVYKSDFEAERGAKEDIKKEKLKLADDLHNLYRRNEQMQKQIESLYREQDNQFNPRSTTRRTEEASGTDSPLLSIYTCPICDLRFRSLKLVEDHIETCICHSPW